MSIGTLAMTEAIHVSVTLPGHGETVMSYHGTELKYEWSTTHASSATENRPKSIPTQRSASGWRPPQPWSHDQCFAVNPYIDVSYVSNPLDPDPYRYRYQGDTDNLVTLDDMKSFKHWSGIEDIALNKALLKLSDQQTDVGENFAERQQAVRMFGDRASQIAAEVRGYKAARPSDWQKVRKLRTFGPKKLGAIPISWLELQYGWKPLLNDVYGGFNLAKRIDKENDSFRVSVKASAGDQDTIETGYVNPNGPLNGVIGVNYTIRRRVGCFVRLDYAMDNPALHQLQQIGLVNPVLLAWNLVPYSFVVDWFLPVGNYLQAWTAALGLRFLGGSSSVYQLNETTGFKTRPSVYHPEASIDVLGGYGRAFNMSRTTFSSSPAPRMPSFKNPLSLGHFANAMSLLVAAFR